ncbi:MAG: hypothetical protein ACTSUE_05155, partial [Promethearchaeota archaeon]
GLEVASRAGIPTRIHAVLTKLSANSKTIEHLSFLSRKFHSSFGFSSPIGIDGIHDSAKDLSLSIDELKKFWKLALEYKKMGHNIYNTYHAMEYITRWPSPREILQREEYRAKKKHKLQTCYAGKRAMYIDSEGFIYPCICRGINNGLNLKDVGIEKAWAHVQETRCTCCIHVQYVEFNDIVSLKAHSIMLGLKAFFG